MKGLHPSPEQLAAFGVGRLSAAEQAEVAAHVTGCAACCKGLYAVPDDTLLCRLRSLKTPADTPMPNECVGLRLPRELADHPRYRIVRMLGGGGMGVVYLAEHRIMGRQVALKVIGRDFTRDPKAVERFRREAKAAAQLSHPNIVTAHDADQAGAVHFLVMEYIDGITLARLVDKRGPLPLAHACAYVRQAALGLQHAYERGMVHRDVKPQNLMLTRQGQVKVLDFGLALLAKELSGTGGPRLTEFGTIMGTPDYIAPEQATDAYHADIRADIYSLGCTLFFLLTGRAPFEEGSATQKLQSHMDREPPRLVELRPDTPAALAAVVERMMAKEPARRYQTPVEAAQALAPFARPSAAPTPVPTVPIEPPRRRRSLPRGRLAALLTAVALMGLAGGLTLLALNGRAPSAGPPQDRPSAPAVAAVVAAPRAPETKLRPPAVLVILAQQFRHDDYVDMRRILEQEGKATVKVASSTLTPCTPLSNSGGDTPVTPDLALDGDVQVADFDAVLIPGGYIWQFKDPTPARDVVWKLMDEMLARDGYIAAVDMGLGVLAASGKLDGKEAADNPGIRRVTKDSRAKWVEQPVVLDGHILTGAEPKDAAAVARKLLECLRQRP